MKPTTRTLIYVIAFVIVVLALVAAVIFGATDLATAKEIALWIAGLFGVPAAATAVAHRPTKPTP